MEHMRVRPLNHEPPAEGRWVLYWMQQSQRAANNPALEHAIAIANERGLPLLVGFGLMDDYPEANLRHYAFMLEGLRDVASGLAARGIAFALLRGHPADVALRLAREAVMVVCDRGYLRHQRQWRERVAAEAGRAVIEVEGDVVVPVDVASDKAEIAARTLRPKLARTSEPFLILPDEQRVAHRLADPPASDLALDDIAHALDRLKLDRTVQRSTRFVGGTEAARERLRGFLAERFEHYAEARSEPVARACSELSPYLHFGQISPVEIALAVREASLGGDADKAGFLEELIVRRELAMNFVARTADYDAYSCLPAWARRTLAEHAGDPRPNLYTPRQIEAGETHDRWFNAAMREMRETGYMHNYMRMYWAKKILEWSPSPEQAFDTTLALNNKLFLDGRDANSYANVGWCYGLHDRPWGERAIFGTVRYMNAGGLERKFDIAAYAFWAETL